MTALLSSLLSFLRPSSELAPVGGASPAMSSARVKSLQRLLNRFTKRYTRGIGALRVDGVMGKATRSRIMRCKWWLGWGKKRSSAVDASFIKLLQYPHDPRKYPGGARQRARMMAVGANRRRQQRKLATKQTATRGVVKFDGVNCAAWLVPYLLWARRRGWKGRLVSGWRSPAYSDSLCRAICGAPRCPGRCAGRSSNHSGSSKPRGALDVSSYGTFGWLMRRCPLSPRIFNALGARDPVHFSASGN